MNSCALALIWKFIVSGLPQGPEVMGSSVSPQARDMERLSKISESPPTSLIRPWSIIDREGEGSPLTIVFVIGCISITTSDRANTSICDSAGR